MHVAVFLIDKVNKNKIQYNEIQDAMLSQGEPRDAVISFDTAASCMRLLWHSMGFLYRPTLATVQMLKLHHTVR